MNICNIFKKKSKEKKEKLNTEELLETLGWLAPIDAIPFKDGDFVLAEFIKGDYQAIHIHINGDYRKWKYGTWLENREIKRLLPMSDIPAEFWKTLEEDGYPPNDSLCLASYSDVNHYEVLEYDNHRWVSELSFPCKFDKYLIIKTE